MNTVINHLYFQANPPQFPRWPPQNTVRQQASIKSALLAPPEMVGIYPAAGPTTPLQMPLPLPSLDSPFLSPLLHEPSLPPSHLARIHPPPIYPLPCLQEGTIPSMIMYPQKKAAEGWLVRDRILLPTWAWTTTVRMVPYEGTLMNSIRDLKRRISRTPWPHIRNTRRRVDPVDKRMCENQLCFGGKEDSVSWKIINVKR